jgi:hypothetical protein
MGARRACTVETISSMSTPCAEAGLSELAPDDVQRHALAGELDR